jgi:uncharacterized membrane-anchored protein YjiN (DUF445 family)
VNARKRRTSNARHHLVVGLLQEVRSRRRSEDGFDDLTEYRDLIAEDESLQGLVSTLLERTGRYLQEQRHNGSHLRRRVEDAAEEANLHLLRNDDLRRQVNERIRDHIVALTTSQSQQATALIEEMVQGWGMRISSNTPSSTLAAICRLCELTGHWSGEGLEL